MGEAYLMKRPGGAAGESLAGGHALICVRLPAGSDCVIARGGESLRINDVPRLAAFAAPSNGSWTATVSDGTRGSSGLIAISGAGEVRAIGLSYPDAPAADADGMLLSAQSGLKSGLSLMGGANLSGNAIRESGTGGFWLSPAVDLSGYSMLTVTGRLRASGGQSRICIGSSSAKVFDAAQEPEMTAVWMGGLNVAYTASVNLSELTGSYYIGSAAAGGQLEITGITLS